MPKSNENPNCNVLPYNYICGYLNEAPKWKITHYKKQYKFKSTQNNIPLQNRFSVFQECQIF